MALTNSLISNNTSEIAAKPKTERNKPITDSLNSTAAANIFKAEVSKITATSMQGRAKALLAAVNKALAAAGIPPIKKVEISHLSNGEQGRYLPRSSTMRINDTVLRGKNLTSEAIATVFHEAVHHQQAYNVARYLATANTAKDIKAYTGIDSSLVDQAVKSVKDKTQSPLTPSQFQTAQNIYRYRYDQTNVVPYERVNEQGITEIRNYQYSDAYYQYVEDARAVIDLINKNPVKYRQEDIDRAVATYNDAYAKYQALPQEQEAFAAEQLVQPTKQGALKISSQNAHQLLDSTSGNSVAQIAAATSSKNILISNIAKIKDDTATNLPKIYEGNNLQENNVTNVSKVVELLQKNSDEVKQQYGLDVTTAEGLGKAMMQYWKENNLDPKTLKEQLPQISNSEFETAFKQVNTITSNVTNLSLTKDKQLV